MEDLDKNIIFKILKWLFIVVSLLFVTYAVYTYRGIYEDGAFYILDLLNSFSDGVFKISADTEGHPRFFISLLFQFPMIFSNKILMINNKFILMRIFTASLFVLPLLALYWNYKLAKRTNRIDIFFWSLFLYCAVTITYSIFAVVETLIGAILHFVLWNYLASNIEYKKRDIIGILFLICMMFATYEYVVILGIIFFTASCYYVIQKKDLKSQLVKSLIGFGGLFASVYNIICIIKAPDEGNEISRFINEAYDFIPHALNLNLSISILTLIILFILLFKKNKLGITAISIITVLYLAVFIRLLNVLNLSIEPMWEQHFRTITCWLVPLIFLIMYIKDRFDIKINEIKFSNYVCIALICGIFQSCWQIVNTFYWDKNIKYLKRELSACKELLYIPAEHEVISDFHHPDLRRYIWHGIYAATSILLSETYEQKTLLVNYDEIKEDGNLTFRERLYVYPNVENKMSVPYGATIDIKNKFWDLTNCARALDNYNKEHNIKTEN